MRSHWVNKISVKRWATSVLQRCGLESYDLDSSQTRVTNLMTLDSTSQNHKTLATRLGLEHQWLGTWLGLEPSDLRLLDTLIQGSPTRWSRATARRADSRRGEPNLQPLLIFSRSYSCGGIKPCREGRDFILQGHHAANHMRWHTRIILLCERRVGGRRSKDSKCSATEPRGDGEPDLNASASGKVKKIAKAECRICKMKITFFFCW